MVVPKAAMRSWTKSGSSVGDQLPIKLCKLTFSTICLIFLQDNHNVICLHVTSVIICSYDHAKEPKMIRLSKMLFKLERDQGGSKRAKIKFPIAALCSSHCPFLGATAWVRELTSNLKAKQFNCFRDKQRNSSPSWTAETNRETVDPLELVHRRRQTRTLIDANWTPIIIATGLT